MNEINEHNENFFKSVWLPLIVSLFFSCVQSSDLASGQIFFDIDLIQIIDTFTICIYAAIIPARIVLYLDNNRPLEISQFILWYVGTGLYLFYSYIGTSFNIIILLISLALGIFSYFNLKNYLTKGE